MKGKRGKRPSSSAHAASLLPHNVLQTNFTSLSEATEHISRLGIAEIDADVNSSAQTPWVEEGLQCIRYLWKKDANTRQKKLVELKNIILSVDSSESSKKKNGRELVEAFSRVVERLLLWEREPRVRINALEVIDAMFEKFRDGTTPFLDKIIPALLALRVDSQRDVSRKARHVYFSHFNTEAKRKKVISHTAESIGMFFKQNSKGITEQQGIDRNASNEAALVALRCLYSALEDLEVVDLGDFPLETLLEKLVNVSTLRNFLANSKNSEWTWALYDLLTVCFRLAEKVPDGDFAVNVTSSSFIHLVLQTVFDGKLESLSGKGVGVIRSLLQLHCKKHILDSKEISKIVNWIRRTVLNNNRTLFTCIRQLPVLFEVLMKVVDESNAECILEVIELRLKECLDTSDKQQEANISSLVSLYLDCVRFRGIKWKMSSDMQSDDQQLLTHLKTFWKLTLSCKFSSQALFADSVLRQLCDIACDSCVGALFKTSLRSFIMDYNVMTVEEESLITQMDKLERIGVFLCHNCTQSRTLILDIFWEFMKSSSKGNLLLELRMLKLFCILNDNTYCDFLEKQLELFLSNATILEDKRLSCMLVTCIQHYLSSADSNLVAVRCRKFLSHCSFSFFSLLFVSLMTTLPSSFIFHLSQDVEFREKVLSTLRNLVKQRAFSRADEKEFLRTFLTVWMEYDCPFSEPHLLLETLLENVEIFKSDVELTRKCLLLLVKDASEQHEMAEVWVLVIFEYLSVLKDCFFDCIWNHLETRWSSDALNRFNSQLCLKWMLLWEKTLDEEDIVNFARLYRASFTSTQFSPDTLKDMCSFLVELKEVLSEDNRLRRNEILLFIRNLLSPQVLKVFSYVGVERLGEFLGCVLSCVESEAFQDLFVSLRQFFELVSHDELEDIVFHIFRLACERLDVEVEDMSPLHSLQETIASTLEILSSSSNKNGRKISFGLIEKEAFLLDDFSFFVLVHISSLNIETYQSELLQLTLESLLKELVLLYNSDDPNSILVRPESSKARLRTVLLCKRIILSNPQALRDQWAHYAVDIVRGLKQVEMNRSQQHENTLDFFWNRAELGYIFHAMDGLFSFALGREEILCDANLVGFIRNIAEGALEEMHNLLVASETVDVDYFVVSCASCSLLLQLDSLQTSTTGNIPECDMQLPDKFYLYALESLLHVFIHEPSLQMESRIISVAKLARKYSSLNEDLSLSLQCYNLLRSLNQELRLTGYSLLAGLDPRYLVADICHSEDETISGFIEETEKLLAFPLDTSWLGEVDETLKTAIVSSEFLGSQTSQLLGYLLTWVLLLNYKSRGDPEFNRILSEYLREHFYLFNDFISFVAEWSVFGATNVSKELQKVAADSASASCTEMELNVSELLLQPVYEIRTWLSSCAKTFGFCLAQLPALSRRWYNDSLSNDRRVKVESFVRRYIASRIIEKEFGLLQLSEVAQGSAGSLQLKPVTVTREVTAIYSFTDTRIEIVLKLPEDFPLSLVTVEAKTSIAMPESKWRKTVLAMSSLLAMKDGNLRDAIDLWRRNLDKQFEGVEECPICYSILHISNGTLPRLECVTCKHKFHAACLYKWLQSSATSSCPICRTAGRFFK